MKENVLFWLIKQMLYFMTIGLSVCVILLCSFSGQEEILSFQISSGENSQTVSLWEHEDGCYYVFLPSYAKLDQVQICLHTGNPVCINGVKLENGMSCMPFSEGVPYAFSYTAWGKHRQEKLIFLQSANVSAMYIDTQSGSMDYIHTEKGNEESGTLTLYLPDGTVEYSGDLASIQGRGNVTWTGFAKKPYSIELAEPANLLDLGSAQKWVLLANADDLSHVRNKVVYDFADRMGLKYAPGSDWVDLYLNGEYAGLYLLSERNEVHPERVNVAENGSFLVSLEKRDRILSQDYPHISTESDQYLRVHYPEKLSASQLMELKTTWQSVENAILAEDDIDPATGKTWMEQIDLDSWVKKYLIEEIFGNIDACFISQFFYCDGSNGEKKIYAGPVWDYDHAMGSESFWQLIAPNTLYANRYYVRDGFETPWFYALYQKDIFYDRMVEAYKQDVLPLLNEFVYEYIAVCTERIAQAYQLNQIRWALEETDIREKAEYLQNFLSERTAFLNSIWIENLQYYMVKADDTRGGIYGHYAVLPGETLTALPMFEDTETQEFLGWYDSATGKPFSLIDPIQEDVAIHAKWRSKSALWLGRIAKWMPLLVWGILLIILLNLDLKWNKPGISRK